jgi:hypothetical protein
MLLNKEGDQWSPSLFNSIIIALLYFGTFAIPAGCLLNGTISTCLMQL